MTGRGERTDYQVLVHTEDGSYWAEIESLPGLFASGDSLPELWDALREAIQLYLSTPDAPVTVTVDEPVAVEAQFDARVLVC